MAVTLTTAFLSLLGTWIGTILLYGVYNLILHPLSSYPGPLLRRAYRIPHTLSVLRGYPHLDVLALHELYGPVVRLAPDELSYTTYDAAKDIYGHYNAQTHGFTELDKDRSEYGQPVHGPNSILSAPQENHARYRRLLMPGFSEKGMRAAQGRIQGYVDLLIEGLKDEGGNGAWLDMRKWFNWTTFDLIGDLAFGESFGCLETREHNPWVDAVFNNVKFVPFMQTLKRYGLMGLFGALMPANLKAAYTENYNNAFAKIERRIPKGSARSDFMDNVLLRTDFEKGTGMTKEEMVNNASILVLGGSETTATLLSGTVYLLLTHPAELKKLNEEVRRSFQDESEIDLVSIGRLSYLGAVLDEAMRVYPPAPNMGNRLVPMPGVEICGEWVPGGTSVGVPQYPTNHLFTNFTRPSEFLPQRWLGDPEFDGDDRNARQPFSMGTRNCIGKNLAYAEMRLILAKVCWNFDMQLDEDRCADWMRDQKVFVLWEKPPLWVKLAPVKQS